MTILGRYGPSLLQTFLRLGPQGFMGAGRLLGPFSELVDSLEIRNAFVRNWVDLLSFLLSGVKADGTLAAEVVRTPIVSTHNNIIIKMNYTSLNCSLTSHFSYISRAFPKHLAASLKESRFCY